MLPSIELGSENFNKVALSLFGIIIGLLYLLIKKNYSYWTREGIPHILPVFPFGNLKDTFLQKDPITKVLHEIYARTSSRFLGIYVVLKPQLMICDPDLVNKILVSDFQHFRNRSFYIDEDKDPLSGHLIALKDNKWKNLRTKLTPAFTPAKLKYMFPNIVRCGLPLVKWLSERADKAEVFEAQEIFGRFTTDVIASVAFGIEVNSVEDPYTMFRLMGKKFYESNLMNSIRNILMFLFPQLMKLLRIKLVCKDLEDFMTSTVRRTIAYREKSQKSRSDFMQLLLELRNTGRIQEEDDSCEDVNEEQLEIPDKDFKYLTFSEVTAQAFIFYIAGFETSSTTLSLCMFELAKHPEHQMLIQNEIDTVLSKSDNELTFNSLMEMKYLNACVNETLRLHTPMGFLIRECTKAYHIPEENYTIKPGTSIIISVDGLHHDPKYYPEPELYNPDRFLGPKKSLIEMPFLPFGQGPRNCIGMQLGLLQTKVAIALMLKNFNFYLDKSSSRHLKLDPKKFMSSSINGINLHASRR